MLEPPLQVMSTLPLLGPPPTAIPRGREVQREPSGFRELYDAEFGRLAGYCFQLTRDCELSQDLAQEAFAQLFSRWRAVREPKPYLFQIATNLVRASWRRQRRESQAWGEADTPSEVVTHDSSVRDAVARLPRRYRDIVLLHYYADLTISTVAQAVRRPEGSVKRMLSEARGLLAQSLEDSRV
jgi:RNA polymerase sigma-70 factor (ECF subfamily)